MREQPKWNHYVCPACGGITIARHDDEGVTPFLIRCRAKDEMHRTGFRLPGCNGMAESQFFNVSQDDGQKPHVIFYRPNAMEAIQVINKEPERFRVAILDHYQQGGSLMKETQPEAKSALKGEAHCHAGSDGECHWEGCPQIKDNEPHKTGRHCPLDDREALKGEG